MVSRHIKVCQGGDKLLLHSRTRYMPSVGMEPLSSPSQFSFAEAVMFCEAQSLLKFRRASHSSLGVFPVADPPPSTREQRNDSESLDSASISAPLSSNPAQDKGVSDVDLLFSHVVIAWQKHRSLYWGDFSPVQVDATRNRNLLVVPGVSAVVAQSWHLGGGDFNLLVNFTNFTIEGLNFLYSGCSTCHGDRLCLAQQRIFKKVEQMYTRIRVSGASLFWNEPMNFAGLGGDVSSVPARLEANSSDIKENCGFLNAMKHISQEHQRLIRSGLVDTCVQGLDNFASVDSRDRFEYARLVVRQGRIWRQGKSILTSLAKFGMVLVFRRPR